MPAWEIHQKICENFEIPKEVTRNIDSLIDNLGDVNSLLKRVEDERILKIFEAYQEIKDNLHDAPLKYPEALYIYLCLAHELHREDGIRTLYLHYIIDYLNPFANWAIIKESLLSHRIALVKERMIEMLQRFIKRIEEDLQFIVKENIWERLNHGKGERIIKNSMRVLDELIPKIHDKIFEITLRLCNF